MDPRAIASRYRSETFENAPPLKIVRMMYQGALRFMEQAEAIDPKENAIGFREKLGRAGAVVTELRVSLDHERAPDISGQLDQLYNFVEDQLFSASTELAIEPITRARGVMERLYSAWTEIEVEDLPKAG